MIENEKITNKILSMKSWRRPLLILKGEYKSGKSEKIKILKNQIGKHNFSVKIINLADTSTLNQFLTKGLIEYTFNFVEFQHYLEKEESDFLIFDHIEILSPNDLNMIAKLLFKFAEKKRKAIIVCLTFGDNLKWFLKTVGEIYNFTEVN